MRQVPTAAEKAGFFSTAVVDPFAAGRPEFSRNAQGQWVIPRERWDPVGAAIVALIPDPNVAGSTIYASTPVTDTRQDQFDVRHRSPVHAGGCTFFGRYSFVDTLTFRPAPLPGLAEGSFNDAFGSNDNRSQGLALGVTWMVSSNLVGDIRFGYARGDYYTYPPNFGIDGAAEVGLDERAERPVDRRRRSQGEHPGLRRGRPAHLHAAVPDTPFVEPARDVQPEPRRALHQVRRGVPARADAHQRPERHDRPHELREPLHEPRRRRSAAGPAVTARADELHGDGPGPGHAVLLRPGRLPRHAEADGQRGPALRIRHAAASRRTISSPTSIPRQGRWSSRRTETSSSAR